MLLLVALIAAVLQQGTQTGTLEGVVVRRGTNFPVPGVQIKVSSDSPTSLETVTDGAGRFVLKDVPAGKVAIEASAEGYMFLERLPGDANIATDTNLRSPGGYLFPEPILRISMSLTAGENLKLPPISASAASTLSGRITDGDGHNIPGVDVDFITMITDVAGGPQFLTTIGNARTDENGEYRRDMLNPGDYQIKATIERPNAATLTVYHPATTDARAAAHIVLHEGDHTTANIEIPKTLEGTFKISGRVLPLPGKPSAQSVGILLKTQGSTSSIAANTSTDERTGSFELRGISPGNYDLFASTNIGDREYLAKVPLEIRARDVEKMEITLLPGADVSGRLTVEGVSKDLQLARPGGGMVRIALSRKDRLFGDIIKPIIDDSGTAFTFRNVPPGEYDITVRFVASGGQVPSQDLYVADIRSGARSVFDSGFEVGGAPTDSMEVIIGTDGGSIAGTVVGASSTRPAVVVLIPDFSRRRNVSLFRAVDGNPDGQFQLRGLTPGIYRIFALPNDTPLSSREEFLLQFEPRAVTVAVEKGTADSGVQVPFLSSR